MPRLYIVEFTDKQTQEKFQKIGWTKEYDVMERFSPRTSYRYGHDHKQYERWNIKVLASAYTSSYEEVQHAEAVLKKRYPKNFWLPGPKFSGITEIVKLDEQLRYRCIQDVLKYREHWANQRKGTNNVITEG